MRSRRIKRIKEVLIKWEIVCELRCGNHLKMYVGARLSGLYEGFDLLCDSGETMAVTEGWMGRGLLVERFYFSICPEKCQWWQSSGG